MTDTSKEIVLIDLSSIAHPIWHMSQSEPDPNATSQKIVARVRALSSDRPHVAICCDAGRSFRKDIAPSYKANRPEHEATLHHQIALAKERLEADGFPMWSVPSFEADDLIATATLKALAADLDVLIVSADKDLLQLVGPRVRAMSVRDGSILTDAEVIAKFGVKPGQMRDYLCLVGDASDNIKGAQGIGPKKAAELLQKYESLDIVFSELKAHATNFKPAMATALNEFYPRLADTRTLVALRTDADIPFEQIASDRVPHDVAGFAFDVEDDMEQDTLPQPTVERTAPGEADRVEAAKGEGIALPGNGAPPSDGASSASRPIETALAIRDEILPAPKEWERGLDPRSMKDARLLAKDLFESRMFSAYAVPQGVLATVMVGRELGLPAMASLRCIHVIEGRHSLSAALMVALVLKAGLAEFFEPVSFSDKEATYETKRKTGRNVIRLQHTFDMAIQAWPKTKGDWQKSFDASGWGRNPTDMLVARASARLARMVYPDLLAGLYTPEELAEIRESLLAA